MSTAPRDVWLVSQVVVLQDLVSCFGGCLCSCGSERTLVVCMCLVMRGLHYYYQVFQLYHAGQGSRHAFLLALLRFGASNALELSMLSTFIPDCTVQSDLTFYITYYDYYTNHHRGVRLLHTTSSHYSLSTSRTYLYYSTTHFNKR